MFRNALFMLGALWVALEKRCWGEFLYENFTPSMSPLQQSVTFVRDVRAEELGLHRCGIQGVSCKTRLGTKLIFTSKISPSQSNGTAVQVWPLKFLA